MTCGSRTTPTLALAAAVALTWVAASTPLSAQAVAAEHGLPPATEVRGRVDSLAKAFIADHMAPGVSIQVVRGGDTIVSGGWGMADLDQQVPATASTLYRIGSITKQFTSASVMRLVEAGRVKLDDSIATYVPNLPAAWRGVTVRELLNHTSGVPSYTDIGERWLRRFRDDMPPDTLVALTASDSMWFAPGSHWRYDNTGYIVLGMLLDHVTGTPYPQYIEQQLVRPLGLEHIYYCDTDRVLPGRARGYQRDGDTWVHAAFLSMTQPYSAGALCSTVGDLARWNLLLASGKVVSPASYHTMTTPTGAAAAHHYGFGLAVDTMAQRRAITHGGGIPGFLSENAYLPDAQLSVTVLTNAGTGNPAPLLHQVARAALGVPLVQPPKPVALTAEQLRRYPGRYELTLPNGTTLPITVTLSNGVLHAQLQGQNAFELIPYGNDVFGGPPATAIRMTFTLEGGRATGFTLVQGGPPMRAVRVE
jgi:D-alanyl-D-alanine carboxypeptidase